MLLNMKCILLQRNPPQKKFKTDNKPKKSSEDEEPTWTLSKNRFIKVRNFRGKLFVDIREFYEKNGELLPGKKGIPILYYLYIFQF